MGETFQLNITTHTLPHTCTHIHKHKQKRIYNQKHPAFRYSYTRHKRMEERKRWMQNLSEETEESMRVQISTNLFVFH